MQSINLTFYGEFCMMNFYRNNSNYYGFNLFAKKSGIGLRVSYEERAQCHNRF